MLTPYHPSCTIPYINVDESPDKKDENENNKIKYGWQPGDGYISIRSTDEIGAYFGNLKRFKIYQDKFPGAKLEDGSSHKEGLTPLCFAAQVFRSKVCEHIVEIGGKHLLEIGSCEKGDTPLLCAIKFLTSPILQDYLYDIVKTLLDLGANPNMANTAGETPLWHALQNNNNNNRLLMLLLINGAKANPRCTEDEEARLDFARKCLFDQPGVKELYRAKYEEDSAFKYVPEDILNEIALKLIAQMKNTL